MTMALPLLSVVSPVFEEEDVLPIFHKALVEALASLESQYRVEIIYVDDGSRDGTLPIMRQLAARDNRVRYLSLSRNFGNQAALTAGLEHATGDAVITIDSDLQHPPSLIPELIARWRQGYDVVITTRSSGTEQAFGWCKRTSSALFHRVMQSWGGLDVRVDSTDFRLLSRQAVNGLLRLRESHRYVRGLVQWLGYPTAEVAFPAHCRRAGATKFTPRRLLRLGLDGLLSFSRVPMRMAVGVGLAVTALSLVASLSWLLLQGAEDPMDYALLIAVHLTGGSVLASVSVLGAYVTRIFEECKQRPLYLLKEVSPVSASTAGRNGMTPPRLPDPAADGLRRTADAA